MSDDEKLHDLEQRLEKVEKFEENLAEQQCRELAERLEKVEGQNRTLTKKNREQRFALVACAVTVIILALIRLVELLD